MRAWAEINLDAVGANARLVGAEVGRDVDVIAVVKADAYGHGLKPVVPVLDAAGVSYFATISLEEARQVRSVSEKDVLVMGYLDTKEAIDAIEDGLTLSVYDKTLLADYERFAARLNRPVKIQLKVETGLNRLGMKPEEALDFICNQRHFPHLKMEALFSHLWNASSTSDSTAQLRIIQELITQVGQKAPMFPVHLVSSYGLGHFRAGYLDGVRVGLALYGVDEVLSGLEPVFTCKTAVMQVKTVRAGEGISYGHLFTAPTDMRVAVAGIGYAEGLSQALTGTLTVLIQGQERPVVGQICMNHIIIDIGSLEVRRGEEVVLIGSQKDRDGHVASVKVSELAKRSRLRHHEIVTRLGQGLPRLYHKGGIKTFSHA